MDERKCKLGCPETIATPEQLILHFMFRHQKEFVDLLTNPVQPSSVVPPTQS